MNSIQSVVDIAQTLLRREKENTQITPSLIAKKVDVALSLDLGFSGSDVRKAAIEELVRRFSHWIGRDTTLKDDEGHEVWLNASRKKEWRYWPRYQSWIEKKISVNVSDALDNSTDDILGLLEDPNRSGAWDRRGLVVGHVQSGKTANYSGLICKAADAGYKVIIVLAGMHNNLRSQTQIRLEEAFLGYETTSKGDAMKLIGVGNIDSDVAILANCATNRSNNGDFSTRVARQYSISPEQRPWLFVVKKNKTVLDRLLKWIRVHVADATDLSGKRYVSNLPLLVIDDEADHASVDTGEQLFNVDGLPDEEHQPKAINSRIRKILNSFAKSAYVGYTATPFANIFIHRKNTTLGEGPDLFPKSFIINLAASSNYVGPVRLFGSSTPDGRVGALPLMRDISDHLDKSGINGWMPPKHKKEHLPLYGQKDVAPPSLEEAIRAFVLACAVKVCRGKEAEHSSMLVHVTRFNLVQKHVYEQINSILRQMKQRISRSIDHEPILQELERLWLSDFVPTTKEVGTLDSDYGETPTWQEILEVLPDSIADIEVRMINGTAKDALDYVDNQGKGLKVIAIGGDKLARGLTLEGLTVSYFVRTTKMYDTLMQMGRWFGYRPGYLDLCRLYTTNELIDWFGHITDASEELREEFDIMAASGGTPNDYGLKVQSHDVLMVTSPLKMRSAETLYLSYSGSLVQTVALRNEKATLEKNLDAAERMFARMGQPSEYGVSRNRGDEINEWKDSFVWNDVGVDCVCDFLSEFETHPSAQRANSVMLVEFIEKQAEIGELTNWTVALLGGGKGEPYTFSNNLHVNAMPTRSDTKIDGRYSIGVLTDPKDESIDLGYEAWQAALKITQSEWKPDPARNRVSEPTRPSGKALRVVRGKGLGDVKGEPNRGLLLIYPLGKNPSSQIENTKKQNTGIPEDWNKPVMAFAVSFPESDSGVQVEYKVDHLLWEEYGSAD